MNKTTCTSNARLGHADLHKSGFLSPSDSHASSHHPSPLTPTTMAYCDRCERWFPHDRALEQHKEDSNSHWACDDCDLDFESYVALREHYIQSPNHNFCKECDRHFKFEESRKQHMDDKHWYCRKHDRVSTHYHQISCETYWASHII